VLIAQAVFLLERRQTNRQRDKSERPAHGGGYAGMGNDYKQLTIMMAKEYFRNTLKRQSYK